MYREIHKDIAKYKGSFLSQFTQYILILTEQNQIQIQEL